jgi:hypothetical protein
MELVSRQMDCGFSVTALFLSSCFFFFLGCGRAQKEPGNAPVDMALLGEAESAYRTNDFQNAWTNLLRHRDALKAWKSSGRQGLNYDLNLAVVNGRLAVMAEQAGLSNDAVAFFEESARYFDAQRARLGLANTNYSKEAIAKLIERWDGTNFIAWRASKDGTSFIRFPGAVEPANHNQRTPASLENGLRSGDLLIQLRAVQELAIAAPTNSALRSKLIDVLWGQASSVVKSEASRSIAASGDLLADDFSSSILRRATLNLDVIDCLARLGRTDDRVLGLLRTAVTDRPYDGRFAEPLEVCLANLGDQVEGREKQIIRYLRSPRSAERVLVSLAFAPPKWPVSADFIDALASQMLTNNYGAALAAMALSQMRDTNASHLAIIRRNSESAKNDDERPAYRLIYQVVLARFLNDAQQLGEATEFFGSEDSFGHTVEAAGYHLVSNVLDEPMIESIVELARADQDQVALGAARWLRMLGLRGSNGFFSLMRIVNSSRDDAVRSEAALALGCVAPMRGLKEIEDLLAKETSYRVQKALQESLMTLSLEKTEK